jgi:CobQ-like glutamine amidotransferase family enzyme
VSEKILRLGHLYPTLMNVYGDRGNIICLQRRARLRGVEIEVVPLEIGDVLEDQVFDIIFMGGAQDRDQRLVGGDLLATKAEALRAGVEGGTVFLGVCGGYQLAGRFYRGLDGEELQGAGVFDLYTVHPGPTAKRLIGNLTAEWDEVPGKRGTLAGFENHGGRTILGPKAEPLAKVVRGHGNDGESGYEGARYKNAFGSYLHGPVLPKNPALADRLLSLALERKYGDGTLTPIDDEIETRAHAAALRAR